MSIRTLIRPTVFAALLLSLPMPGYSERLGQIIAFLEGEAATWHTITMQQLGETRATASITLGSRLTEVNVQGHPEPRFTAHNVMSVDVRYLGTYSPDADPLTVDIMFMPDGMGGPFWTSKGAPEPSRIDIISLELIGSYGRLEAAFAGQLCLREFISTRTDPTICREVTGMIDTRLQVEQPGR